jgi:putative phosphonate transport system ATP-binding protein
MTSPKPLLKVQGLSKIFGHGCPQCITETGPETETNICSNCHSIIACHDISFDIYSDEVLGIVGESGSGKSTVLQLIHFDLPASAGKVTLNENGNTGHDEPKPANDQNKSLDGLNLLTLSSYKQRMIRNRLMGFVFQNPHLGLKLHISAGGNIAERLLAAGWRNVARIRERASGLLERTQVPSMRMDELPSRFSGGMQQRVQIAKAISNGPLILLLDELTTGLDVSVQAKVLDLIRKLQQEMNMAILVVSHDLGVINMLTRRTLVMKNGRIVEAGLTDQILEDPQHPYTQLMVSSML